MSHIIGVIIDTQILLKYLNKQMSNSKKMEFRTHKIKYIQVLRAL